jgi:hypothetical protein
MEKKLYYVYELIDPRDDKIFYVGKGKDKRMYVHYNLVKNCKFPNRKNYKLYKKLRELINENYKPVYKKIFESYNELETYKKEEERIKEIGLENLCNITLGFCLTCKNKKRFGKIPWNKGKNNCYSIRTLNKMSESHKGKKCSGTGKKAWETRRKNSNHIISNETKQKISKSLKGKHYHTNESKNKMSLAKKGKIPWNKGKNNCYSKDQLQRISKSVKKSMTFDVRKKISEGTKKGMTKAVREKLSKSLKNYFRNKRLGKI